VIQNLILTHDKGLNSGFDTGKGIPKMLNTFKGWIAHWGSFWGRGVVENTVQRQNRSTENTKKSRGAQSCEAETKEQPTAFSRRRRERGDAEEQPKSQTAILSRRHGGTEKKCQVKKLTANCSRRNSQNQMPFFLSFLRALRASVRERLLEISFYQKKKLKISVQGIINVIMNDRIFAFSVVLCSPLRSL
jgi:hypothetical protein